MISGSKSSDATTKLHYVYDAWNRLTAVYADSEGELSDLIAEYKYDGANHRVSKTLADETGTEYYYNQQWQLLEERTLTSDPEPLTSVSQYVWSASYIDAPVVRFHDGNADGNLDDAGDSVRHCTWDANQNVTTTITDDTGGSITTQHVAYDAYGKATEYNGGWTTNLGAPAEDGPLYCGYWFDLETGSDLARNRYYSVVLAAWFSRDPITYEAGDPNLYRYCGNSPVVYVDPSGTNYWDYVTKLNGGHIYKAVGGAAGGLLQLATWITPDVNIQAGAQTGLIFFPDTCEIGLYSIKMGVVKALNPNAGPPKVAWEGGLQLGLNASVEVAAFTGPGTASAASFAGIFYTGQASGGSGVGIGVSGYKGVPGKNGAYWYGGTVGVTYGPLPISVGTVAWAYQLITSVDLDDGHGWFLDKVGYCQCLELILAM